MTPEDADVGSDSARATAAAPTEETHQTADAVRFTPGTLLAGRYRIISPLGKGGMGEVYRADDVRLGQHVALKFLPAALASDRGRLARLEDEVRIGRQISHPNVCRLYDIVEAGGHHFLVMEYVDGEDLASLLRRIDRLPGDKALEIARGICAGLAAAHDKGVIHRDLKPANVMIDGKGHARIADFGLAAEGNRASDLSGTPAYMAPEQIAGDGATLRSDVFALGLVLSEMVTGQRVFQAGSLEELKALHAQSKPLSLSSSAKDVDPAFERVVHRCLARDPRERPESARAVLAMLPGGDPLQAALLAGETPSPEMVAAAGIVGDLRPAVAWLALAGGLLGLLAIAAIGAQVNLFRRVPLTKSPEVLEARAREILTRLGHPAAPADSARGFIVDNALLDYVEEHDRTPTRLQTLRAARPGPLRFYYRQSPRPMVSNGWVPVLPWLGPPDLGRVLRDSPPTNFPGMADVVMDPDGRLTSLVVVPPRLETSESPWPDVDWSILIVEAGLDPTAFKTTAPRWAAPVDSDRKQAWDGVNPGNPAQLLHLEAAAYHGRLVYFEVQGPWARPPSGPAPDRPGMAAAKVIVFLMTIPLVVGGVALVRRNLRMGRGDRRGAFRLGLLMFATLALAQSFRADHTSLLIEEYALVIHILSQACYAAIVVWSFYMALEPAVRRRWPRLLISWSRIQQGRWQDPLVGRDVLVGLLLGLGVTLCVHLGNAAPAWLGQPPRVGNLAVLTSLNAPRQMLFYFCMGLGLGMVYSLSLLFMLYLAHTVVRREWLARALVFAFMFAPIFSTAEAGWIDLFAALAFAGLIALGLMRFGLLTSMASLVAFLVSLRAPLTLDVSAWYAGRSFAVLGFLAVALVFAFYTSLGGKPMFGRALLED